MQFTLNVDENNGRISVVIENVGGTEETFSAGTRLNELLEDFVVQFSSVTARSTLSAEEAEDLMPKLLALDLKMQAQSSRATNFAYQALNIIATKSLGGASSKNN